MSKQVLFFSTCIVEHLYPNIGMDALAVLKHFGYQVQLPEYQSCCGQPAYNSGAKTEALSVARATIDTLANSSVPIVVPSASCADMLIHHYPKLFANTDYQEKAERLARSTFELISFLSSDIQSLPSNTEKGLEPTALHISCSARRALNCAEHWQRASEHSSNSTDEPRYAEECCGFGGTFAVKAPEISSVMARDKCEQLMNTGAQSFLTGDCGCMMHLNGYAKKQAYKLQGEHLITRVAKQLGLAYAK